MGEFPIDPLLPRLRASLVPGATVLLQSPPGAGKTTRVPLALLGEIAGTQPLSGRTLMLEPRRLAARAAATRIAISLQEPLGERVGYSVRHEQKRSSRTRIEAMTDGLFLRRLQNDPELTGINCVIFDEFHERSRNSELALALVREAQELLRPDLCLLLMSATLDLTNLRAQLPHAQVLTSEGKAFPVETQHLSPRANERLEGHVLRAIEQEMSLLASAQGGGDHPPSVLVFLPGVREIERCRQRLLTSSLLSQWEVIALHGRQSLAEQGRALKPCDRTQAGRVILATSIAESSLTLEGVRLVIDCGLTRHTQFDPGTGMEGLITVPASQASADQRRGRAGRQSAGRCIRLWSPAEQQRRPAHDIPELQRADPQPTVLDLALWGAGLGESLPWIEAPPRAALQEGQRQLLTLGALNPNGRPTDTGQQLARFGAHPRLGLLLLQARALGRPQVGADLAAILSERDLLSHHNHGSDLWARMQLLRDQRSSSRISGDRAAADRLRTVLDQSRRWLQQLGQLEQEQDPQGMEATDEQLAAQLVATAFPEWVAMARPGQRGQFLLRQGRGAALQVSDPLDGAEALAIAQLDLGDTRAKIRLALPLSLQWVRELANQNGHWQERVLWDEQTKRVRAERVLQLGALELERQVQQQASCEQSREVLIKQLSKEGLSALPWSQRTEQLRSRLALAHQQLGPPWPQRSLQYLEKNPNAWIGDILMGCRGWDDVKEEQLIEALWGDLAWSNRQQLDQLLPTHINIPSGRHAALHYQNDDIVLSVKLQEMFGCLEGPAVLNGQLPVTIELLSPAGRPLQRTRDLAGFWHGSYQQVRKEMRGRYPKHPWPEDPAKAEPTAKRKARS